MYRFLFRPSWLLFHAVVLAAIVVMVNLGFWQLDRLDERQTFNRQVLDRIDEQPVDVSELLEPGGFDPDTDEWTLVRMTGTYLPDQIVEFNQSQAGRAGDNVLTALVLDDAVAGGPDTVIVNRGFVPLPTAAPAPPAVRVEVIGVARPSEVRDRGELTDPDAERITEIRRIDLERVATQYPGVVAPFYVQLLASDPPPGVGDPEPVARPELDDGPHLSYAVQWFIFSLCVAIGWVLAVRRSLAVRRRAAAAEEAAADEALSDERVDADPERTESVSGRH